MIRSFLILSSVLLIACGSDEAEKLEFQIESGLIDLSNELQGDWDRVCVLLPYTTNEIAQEQLGFEYNVMSRSGISVLDGISLLVTINSNTVVGEYEVPLKNADFASLGAKCYQRENSKFSIVRTSDGWNEIKNT